LKTLIWSVAWGDYRYMLQSLVKSMKDVGIEHDVLVYCDEALSGCKNKQMIDSIALDQTQYWKFEYLNKVAEMDYDLFVFIDSDHFFVRKPSLDFHQIIGQDQWHSFLESPINDTSTRRQDWWGLSNPKMVTLWRAFGVNQKTLYNTNGGFWICRKNFAQQARETVTNFREFQRKAGFNFPEEVAIAVLSHMFSADYSARLHKNYMDIWASEWTGALKDIIPNGKPWKFVEYMTNTESVVDPAIVHAMRSKKALVELGKYEMNRNTQRKYS
jgi:hypothetical protein